MSVPTTRYTCANLRRLRAVKQAGTLNGIEYVEVRDRDEPVVALRQRTLYVRLLDAVPAGLRAEQVVVAGGERIPTVAVEWAAPATALPTGLSAAQQAALLDGLAEPDRVLVVRTAARGDFSRYHLRLVATPGSADPPSGFDPLLVDVDLWFKVECDADFDCADDAGEPVGDPPAAPVVDYLAKDYEGFRRLMLERMALTTPGWTERNPADVGVTLVELLAFAADELSYRQDAIATEAYLGTARSRVSLRRHARLVDYRVHDGCNARAWVRVQVDSPGVLLPAGTTLLTQVPGLPARVAPGSAEHAAALAAAPVHFETVADALLDPDLRTLDFWTWGEQGCTLPAGATQATLLGDHPRLRAGDVLVLAETRSPVTLVEADADPSRRWAVRLVDVRPGVDPSGGLFTQHPPVPTPVDVTHVRWHPDDALPFPLTLSVLAGDTPTAQAWGNVVLADHGRTVPDERLPPVVSQRYRPALVQRPLTQAVVTAPPARFEVALSPGLQTELDGHAYGPLLAALATAHGLGLVDDAVTVRGTHPAWSLSDGVRVVPLAADGGTLRGFPAPEPAGRTTAATPRTALPALALQGTLDGVTDPWTPRPDLLGGTGSARALTVETEHDGTAWLRFGDDEHGMRPDEGTVFVARYRVGNGVEGNVGAGALAHAVTTVSAVTEVSQPLPATGGVDAETAEEIRRDAPAAFAVAERAVTAADYEEVAARSGRVQRAAATFRWTGSWHTVFVTADRPGGAPVDEEFEADLRAWLERYRMAGYDLEVDAPVHVPLEIGLHVCVAAGHFRADVGEAVRAALGRRVLPDGRRGLFHPDNLTFGQPVYLSAVLAAAHAVPGVESVEVRTFRRQRARGGAVPADGVLPMGRLEIARLDDDPSFPERGVLVLTLGGGT